MSRKDTRLNRRQFSIGAVVGGLLAPSYVRAQEGFPNRPLRMILPYAPGGATDTIARIVAQRMSDILGQQVIVENKSGAGGVLGTREGVRAEPDGYTILFGNVSTLVLNAHLYKKLPYDPLKELKPLTLICDVPNVLVVSQESEIASLADLIKKAKENPGKESYGTAGNGTIMHLSTVLFEKLTGASMTHVPYRGSLPSLQDIMAGRVLMMIDNITGPLALLKGQKLKALAVSTEKRIPALPEVPTFAEAGLPGFVNKSWFGLCTQAATPAPIRQKLEQVTLAAIQHPATQERLLELGNIPRALGAEAFRDFWNQEDTYWKPIVQLSGISLD
ncbi:Bug family tripartite tricarboxylate transporter substrate binding protein [Tardiphaga sp.]|jgi:tripartite-type tricarboxylate transporter receptor subunit TctC|uniref:Bug family tripartite tricarboxylate transporter substrate binding protein n=1 Tax=Tardiphaga sp. TaxID=1926292 RepID=UPI0037DA1AB3